MSPSEIFYLANYIRFVTLILPIRSFAMFIKRFLVLIIGSLLSYYMVKYRYKIGDTIGPISFAEKYLGGGGTYTFIVIFAIFIFFCSLTYATGSLDIFFQENVKQYFGGDKPIENP